MKAANAHAQPVDCFYKKPFNRILLVLACIVLFAGLGALIAAGAHYGSIGSGPGNSDMGFERHVLDAMKDPYHPGHYDPLNNVANGLDHYRHQLQAVVDNGTGIEGVIKVLGEARGDLLHGYSATFIDCFFGKAALIGASIGGVFGGVIGAAAIWKNWFNIDTAMQKEIDERASTKLHGVWIPEPITDGNRRRGLCFASLAVALALLILLSLGMTEFAFYVGCTIAAGGVIATCMAIIGPCLGCCSRAGFRRRLVDTNMDLVAVGALILLSGGVLFYFYTKRSAARSPAANVNILEEIVIV